MKSKKLSYIIFVGAMTLLLVNTLLMFSAVNDMPTDGTGHPADSCDRICGVETNWNNANLDLNDDNYWKLEPERIGWGRDRFHFEVFFEDADEINQIKIQATLENTGSTYYKVKLVYISGQGDSGLMKVYEGSKYIDIPEDKTLDHIEIYKNLLFNRDYELLVDYLYGIET